MMEANAMFDLAFHLQQISNMEMEVLPEVTARRIRKVETGKRFS